MFSGLRSLIGGHECMGNRGTRAAAQRSPVDNIKIMEVFQCKKEFCAVEATTFFVEFLFALEVMEEFSSVNESRRADQNREV
jgi:hypothetical protein